MKKTFYFLTCLVIVCALAACGNNIDTTFCSHCNEELPITSLFCSQCGNPLNDEGTESTPNDEGAESTPNHEEHVHQYTDDGICEGCNSKSVEISMPEFPTKVSTIDGQKLKSSIEITNITYETSYFNYDGEYNFIHFTVQGKKTFDVEGNNISNGSRVAFKVRDSEGNVIHSGSFSIPSLVVGDTFKQRMEYTGEVLNYLPSGEYKLELLDTVY